MLRKWTTLAGAVLALLAFPGSVGAQQEGQSPKAEAYVGSSLYETYCAVCHGAGGKGDGQFAGQLRSKPADLTLIAKNKGGTFLRDEVARIIDGRDPVKGHGGKDMPVWGDAFSRTPDTPAAAAAKIKILVAYLESIQQKP
jgi:mono/diheme cytochrome c family protein